MLDFKLGGLRKILEAMRNWGMWSEIDEMIIPDIILGDIAFENILSIRVTSHACWLK